MLRNDSATVLSLEQNLEEEHSGGRWGDRGPSGILILELTLKSRSVLPEPHGAGLHCSSCEVGGAVKLVFPEYWKKM